MTRERISQLLAPFLGADVISEDKLAMISDYLDLLVGWNAKINLTALRDPEDMVTRHFGESLFTARHLFRTFESQSLVDIGTGAGFPGLPAKIWQPQLELTLIESQHKKTVFLKEVIRTLRLSNTVVLASRAETVRSQADVVTFRAVERFDAIVGSAHRMVKPGGRLVLLIGKSRIVTVRHLLADVLWEPPLPIPLSTNRILLLGRRPSSQALESENTAE
ncbi:MAG: 16S rRNA (guanine(527)-N(7))-methyltransferase RsmG [Acidobacteria bacterium]|nr:16S rRNA (guanine(527)-N(7))-methyltransferase RsmG [Acidobacteriota bacterium]